jgi:hypothetical protein
MCRPAGTISAFSSVSISLTRAPCQQWNAPHEPVAALRPVKDRPYLLLRARLFRSITRHGRIGSRMSAYAVALVVRQYAGAVGLETEAYAGHSLRAGLATSAAIAGPVSGPS